MRSITGNIYLYMYAHKHKMGAPSRTLYATTVQSLQGRFPGKPVSVIARQLICLEP
jgi:hypothetical protein